MKDVHGCLEGNFWFPLYQMIKPKQEAHFGLCWLDMASLIEAAGVVLEVGCVLICKNVTIFFFLQVCCYKKVDPIVEMMDVMETNATL